MKQPKPEQRLVSVAWGEWKQWWRNSDERFPFVTVLTVTSVFIRMYHLVEQLQHSYCTQTSYHIQHYCGFTAQYNNLIGLYQVEIVVFMQTEQKQTNKQ